jgi:protein required for attachment to host cells
MPTGRRLAFAAFDGASAQAFLYERAERRLAPLPGFPKAGAKKPQFSDSAPRSFQSEGAARSAIDPKTDPERELETRFVGDVADALEALRIQKAFSTLVVAAPPRALGAWRERAPGALRALVKVEIAKNYAGRDAKDLPALIEDAMLG